MKAQIAEYLKLVSALGPLAGLKVGVKKNTARGEFAVGIPGVDAKTWIRKDTSDWIAFKQVFVWKEYEYPIPFSPATILDAGANVGYAAQWFARKFPQASIVSLEPESNNFSLLQKNVSGYANVQPVKAGLWGRSCYLRIIPTDRGNWAFRTEETQEETPGSIKALSIPEIMESNNWQTIDLLKMDIEGAEKNVFASNAERWLPRVRMMFLEMHDNIDRSCSKNVFKALLNFDFSVDVSGENFVFINHSIQ